MNFTHRLLAIALISLATSYVASSQTCNLVTSGTTLTLMNDCYTTSTITIPDGFTLNGNSHTITALNPSGPGTFQGPILTNAPGALTIHVKNVILDAPNMGVGDCSNPVSGIIFDSVSGSITGTTVLHILNTDGSVFCSSSEGIEVTNATSGGAVSVTVSGNKVLLSGLEAAFLARGSGVTVNVTANEFSPGASFSTAVFLDSAGGTVTKNSIEASGGYGILLSNASRGTKILSNNLNLISGTSFQGIAIYSDNAVISGNRVFNYGTNGSGEFGVVNVGAGNPSSNSITKNEVRCYETPFYGSGTSNGNVVLSCPWP